jgi:hypothetical protein
MTPTPLSLVVNNDAPADEPQDEQATITSEALTWPARARELDVVDPASYTRAGEWLLGVRALRQRIAAHYDPKIEAWKEAKRHADKERATLVNEHQQAEAPLVEAEGVLAGALRAYDDAAEEARRLEEERLQAEAQAAEEQRVIETAAALETVAAEVGDETLREQAHEMIAAPVVAPTVHVASSTPAVSGISHRTTWHAEVTDIKALCRAIADGTQPATLVTANMTVLNGLARSLKNALTVPGVRAVPDRGTAVRTR